jgi:membrane-bound lytic murein transglycosylase MltF
VVTGPASPRLATINDLAGKEVWVRHSSSYWTSLKALGRRFAAEKRASLRLVEADEHLEDEDLLDMLNAGLIPLMVVDDHKAELWAKMLPKIKVRENIVVREEGRIGFAIRKRSPKLKAALDAFVAKNEKGTTFGNVVFNRYLADTDFVKDAASKAKLRKFEKVLNVFRRFADRYAFDPLMLAAQGYQESQLDNSVRSKAGAIGIMQVLPLTAKDPNVDIADITVLENNIHAAAKYMRFVMDTFFPDAKMDPFNRTMFAFASYNAGPAKIAKLRRQAASRGLDPNQWFGQVERVVAERIGRETVQYVSNILKYYVLYRRIDELQARKERALKAASTKPF